MTMPDDVPMVRTRLSEDQALAADDGVYHKIRLDKPHPGSDGKLRWIMNGISANSWFTPVGITDRLERSSTPYGPVSDEIRVCLQERAQSAASFLGRRHFETDKQALKTDEILRGRNVYCKSEADRSGVKDNAKGRFSGKSSCASPKDMRSKMLLQRPQTSYSVRSAVSVDTDFIRPHIESLKIQERKPQPINSEKKSTCAMCNHANTHDLDDGNNEAEEDDEVAEDEENKRENHVDLQEKKSSKCDTLFKTAREMKHAFNHRVCSAPPLTGLHKEHSEEALTNRPEGDATPLYWKTRTVYHRKQLAGADSEEDDSRAEFFSKGSLLKPLMYQKGSDLKHSAGCPYKCKGCFRACLVSQDYLDALKQRKLQHNRKRRYVRPKMYHRRIIELALAKSQPIHKMIERRNVWNK